MLHTLSLFKTFVHLWVGGAKLGNPASAAGSAQQNSMVTLQRGSHAAGIFRLPRLSGDTSWGWGPEIGENAMHSNNHSKKKNGENNLEIIECLNPKAINKMFETISSKKVTICNLNGQLVAFFLGFGWVPPISWSVCTGGTHACACVKVFQRAHWESGWVSWQPLSHQPTQGWANPLLHENTQNSCLHSEGFLTHAGKIKT